MESPHASFPEKNVVTNRVGEHSEFNGRHRLWSCECSSKPSGQSSWTCYEFGCAYQGEVFLWMGDKATLNSIDTQTTVTLTVSNFLVVVTYLYVIFSKSSGHNDGRTDTTPVTERRSQLPDGGHIKSTPEPHNPVYILTQFDSNGSVLPWSQQGGLTAFTYAGSELGWLPRPPSTMSTNIKSSQVSSSFSPNSRNGSHQHGLSSAPSEPCPQRPPKIYSSTTGTSDERRISQHH